MTPPQRAHARWAGNRAESPEELRICSKYRPVDRNSAARGVDALPAAPLHAPRPRDTRGHPQGPGVRVRGGGGAREGGLGDVVRSLKLPLPRRCKYGEIRTLVSVFNLLCK